jgi:histidyl-tRNA synthetase
VKLAFVRHDLGTAADGLDGDLIAAGDRYDGLQFRIEKTPVAGFGAGMQVMMGHEEAFGCCNGVV